MAEPKTLRYRVLHAAARLIRGGRRHRPKIQAAWPGPRAITGAPCRVPMQHERSAYPNLDGFSINGMSTSSDRLHRL
jgi:hypothetical protein